MYSTKNTYDFLNNPMCTNDLCTNLPMVGRTINIDIKHALRFIQ